MDLDEYLDSLCKDSERIAEVAESVDLQTSVAPCPEWTLGDLVYHVGEVHRFWQWVANERVQQMGSDVERPVRPQPEDADLVAWFREGAAMLIDILAKADPTEPVWSWTSQHDMAFIQRRMPQETAVHRWDAESVTGVVSPIDRALAADGIDEFFLLAAAAPVVGKDCIGLAAIDTGDRWSASVSDERMQLTRGASGEDVVLSGTASDLLLVLWRRLPHSALQVNGDDEAAVRFLNLAALD
jgi:uncharacterized protein (TIGR03083 family)